MSRRSAILGVVALLGAAVAALIVISGRTREENDIDREGRDASGKTNRSAPPSATQTGAGNDGPVTAADLPREMTGWTLRGRLVRHPDPDALEPTQPVAGALVRIALGKDSGEPRPDFAPREVRSGADGRYAFEGVPGKAEYRVDVDAEGCALRAVGFELPDVQDATTKEIPEIVLDEPVRFVVILKGPGGALRGDGRVQASRSDFRPHSRHDDALRLREEKLEAERQSPGELVFEGMGSGRPVRRSVHVPEGGSMSLDVDMDNARVWGTITSAGEPVPKALILFESDSGELVTSNPTTEDGAWSLELPAPHGYTLQVYRDGQALGAPRALDLSSADEVRVDIETEKN